MVRWLGILARTLASTIRTQRELALENLALRQQVAVWKVRPPRPQLTARDLSSAVRAGGVEPRAAPAAAFQYHGASDRRVDGTTTDRGVRAGREPSASDPGPGSGLWRTIFASSAAVGHPGGGPCATLAMAKRLCGEGDWLAAAGMPLLRLKTSSVGNGSKREYSATICRNPASGSSRGHVASYGCKTIVWFIATN